MISAHLKLPPLSDLQPILNNKPMFVIKTYTQYYPINTLYVVKSPTSSRAKWLEISTFIFYFIVVVLDYINLVLLGITRAYQSCTTNKSYKIGINNARA